MYPWGVNFCKDHPDKIEVPDPLAVGDLKNISLYSVISLANFRLVSLGLRLKGVWIDYALVKDHSLSLGFFDRFQRFGVGISFDLVGILYVDDSWFVEGCSDFVDDVGFEKVKVQLGLSAHVEGESAYLTFHFSVLGSVTVI